MKRPAALLSLSFVSLVTLAACSGGGGGNTAASTTGGDFLLLHTQPAHGNTIYLNDPIGLDFSNEVDVDSASLTTVQFLALDQLGNPSQDLVSGNFGLGTSPGDSAPGRRLLFVPRLPSNNNFSNGGFKAGRTYLCQLVGGTSQNQTVLRDRNGRALTQPVTFAFSTVEGTQAAQLFRNPIAGGPQRTGLFVTTATDLDDVPLGLFGAPPLEVRLRFDQALNPHDANVPVDFDTNPLTRLESQRGRIFLEYHDPELDPGALEYTWIPADVELEVNDFTGAVVVLRPVGVLPSNAEVRIIVEATVEDISGESNLSSPVYNRVFGVFHTQRAFEQQWNGIAEDFLDNRNIDPAAVFAEAQAEVGPGYVKAGFAFEGNSTTLEYEPTSQEIVLNTAFTQVVPKAGLPFTVTGGVFHFANVLIPQGVTVLGQGPNPMVWLCSGDFTVAGTLSVRGGNGTRVDTVIAGNYAKAGGVGQCGGGNGGDGSPNAFQRDLRGGTGRGPRQAAGMGGRGGYLSCVGGCSGGSGGGGGTMATQGDPHWRGALPTAATIPNTPPTANTSFQQRMGYGGAGCSGGSGARSAFLAGGEVAPRVFTDSRSDNDFWGSAVRLGNNLRITGELDIPVGGGGGGGGGDASPGMDCSLNGGDPTSDYSGGGGGGGGGVLMIKALGSINVTASGKLIADGGHGGGGAWGGNSSEAGGGGGGAGGMVILMAARGINIVAHGSAATNCYVYGAPTAAATATHPFLRDDYNFAIAADGGLTLTGSLGSGKYPAAGAGMMAGTQYDGEPRGALGGLGIVQLMVPPGANTDGTNTALDDNINFYLGTISGAPLSGAQKRQLLGWRGFPNAQGVWVDDNGLPTNILGTQQNPGGNEGDIRPSPTLMPCPFSPQSRVRSKWIDTGSSQREYLRPGSTRPSDPHSTELSFQAERRVAEANGAVLGPVYEFAGLKLDGPVDKQGYLSYSSFGQSNVKIEYPTAVQPVAVAGLAGDASHLGKPAYKVTLATPALGEANRYSQYEGELLNNANAVLAGFRILSHTDSELLLDPTSGALPTNATKFQVRAKFFKIITNGTEGLGTVVPGTNPTPIANLRIGFAFHNNPQAGLTGRFPPNEQQFLRDLDHPDFLAWIDQQTAAANGANRHPRYVQWDVIFDLAFAGQPLRPATPRPELHFLRLPFRF